MMGSSLEPSDLPLEPTDPLADGPARVFRLPPTDPPIPPRPAVTKSVGTTPSERYLASLCERTFLSLWSYPNVFRDQGQRDGRGDGKELCDLLVVFGDDVIIFSDKSCAFPNTGDLAVDWGRWYRRSIAKSVDQVYGAERWLREYPDRVFLDAKCTQRLPLALAPSDRLRVHRVVVALNAGPRCKEHFDGRGSLLVDNAAGPSAEPVPFVLHAREFTKGFVHVFDDVSLDAVLRELDTVADFTAYLRAKEQAFASVQIGMAAGEEELLGYYLRYVNAAGQHHFRMPGEANVLLLDEGFWEGYLTSKERRAKQEADRVSYVWDGLIESFARHIADGRSFGADVVDAERCLRIVAAEPRVARRMLGRRVYQALQTTPPDQKRASIMMTAKEAELAYVFLLMPHNHARTYDEYRQVRVELLRLYAMAVGHDFPHVRRVIGITREPQGYGGCSEDLMLYVPEPLTEEQVRDLDAARETIGIMLNARERLTVVSENEYPIAPMEARAKPTGPSKPSASDARRKKRKQEARARRRNR